ncbi:MAG: HIT family protein [Phycisphaerales bacterium]
MPPSTPQSSASGCPLCDRGKAIDAKDPAALSDHIATFTHCHAILSENQGTLAGRGANSQTGSGGWVVLVLRHHAASHPEHLADLPIETQSAIFAEVARVANAIRTVFGPVRINYECLGNVVPHIHWHVIPRDPTDPTDPDPRKPVWGWSEAQLKGTLSPAQRLALRDRLRAALR